VKRIDCENAVNVQNKKMEKTYGITDYAINYNAFLLMQLLGIGVSGLNAIITMLGILSSCGSLLTWHKMRDTVGEVQCTIAKEVMSENLEKEINATSISGVKQVSFMSKLLWPLTCAIDFAWQQWSCGVAYNSLSGHCFLMGARTQKILDTVFFQSHVIFAQTSKKLNEPMGEIPPNPHIAVLVTSKDHQSPWTQLQ